MEDSNKKRYPIRLRNIKDIMAFVNAANEIDGTCEVITGRYRVDAKSLMIFYIQINVYFCERRRI